MRRPGRQSCSVCGETLTPHQEVTGGVCDAPYCQRKLAVGHALEAEAEKRGRAAEGFENARKDDAERSPGGAHLVEVPANTRFLTGLPEERREAIRASLEASLEDARARIAALDGEEWAPPPPRFKYGLRDRDMPILMSACAVCRGRCCELGADHAFLYPDELAPRILADPDLTDEALIEEYLGLLPDVSFEGACVYQGSLGCTIPRGKRSSVCNGYFCESILALRDDLVALEPRSVFAVSMDSMSVRGGALLDVGRSAGSEPSDEDRPSP